MAIILVTGPARSGKSEWAERLAAQLTAENGKQVVYVATAQRNANDVEWQARIEQHVQRRPESWLCKEVSVELAEAIAQSTPYQCLLVDSLGTWLANLIEQTSDEWAVQQEMLLKAIAQTNSDIVLVAEETGWGIVPAYELGRTFRDRLGTLSRRVGAIANSTYLVTGGYALNLTALGHSIDSR